MGDRDRDRDRPTDGERRGIYVGNIAHATPKEDVEAFFGRYGDITKLDWKTGYCFVEYDNYKDAAYVVEKLNGWEMDGRRLNVQFPHGKGPSSSVVGRPPPPRPGLHGVRVYNIPSSVSWQDLKDFGKRAAPVTRSNVYIDDRGRSIGLLEFANGDDADRAVRHLDGEELKGNRVEVSVDRGGGGGGGSRGGDRDRHDSRDRDRSRDRRRSRSPRRDDRDRDRRRSRSPRRRSPDRDRDARKRSATPP